MKTGKVKLIVLIMLIALNVGLFASYAVGRMQEERTSTRELSDVMKLYEEENISFRTMPSTGNDSYQKMKLESADLDRLTVEFLSGASYERTLIYDSRVQYICGSITLLVDYATHSVQYRDSSVAVPDSPISGLQGEGPAFKNGEEDLYQGMLEEVGRGFAQRFFGGEVFLVESRASGQSTHLTFAQVADNQILYFNNIEMTLSREGISSATVTYWKISENEGTLSTLAIDEQLYAHLVDLEQTDDQQDDARDGGKPGSAAADAAQEDRGAGESGETPNDEVIVLMDGYEILEQDSDTAVAVPNSTMLLASGRKSTIRLTGQ